MTKTKTTRTKLVYLAYTTNSILKTPELLKIYSKSSYCEAYNWIAELAEMHGNAAHPLGLKIPTSGKHGDKIAVEVVNPTNGQRWWLESHEVI